MRYYLISGEASGDLHGANIMKGLLKYDPDAEFRFWGGDQMSAIGGELVRHYKETAVMGIIEVLGNLGKISKNMNDCKADLLKHRPDILILIDYPGFNLRIAKFAKQNNIKVFYYIPPKVWAWRESRIKQLKEFIDKIFIIFPFEVEYFKSKGIETIYYGNPLIDKIEGTEWPSVEDFKKKYNLSPKPSIALLVGSRRMEIEYLLPRLKEVINKFSDEYQFLLAAAPSIEISYYEKLIPEGVDVKIIPNDTYACLKHSAAAVVSSGTASLETAIIGTPQVVCYGVNPISYYIAKKLVKLKYVSLGNLIIDRLAFKELLQQECNAENIIAELKNLLFNKEYKEKMLLDYAEIRRELGESGSAERIAKAMIEECRKEAR